MPPSPPTTLGRYTLLSRLGAGGMGEVWRAHDANLDGEVAVKLLNPGALVDQTSRGRFRREAHVLSRLSHPGIATIYDFDSQDGVDFLVVELVTGGTLESRIANPGNFVLTGSGQRSPPRRSCSSARRTARLPNHGPVPL
ncbi:MAG: protein kinase domain-containing protein [Gemmatimonadaceae bacterium]